MNETMRAQAAKLRSMSSSEAAEWLLRHYPNGGEAIVLVEHVSLRKGDLYRLAEQYLSGPTAASARPYLVFAQLLGLPKLIRVLGAAEGRSAWDAELLAYHLKPLVEGETDKEGQRIARAFISCLSMA